MLVSLGETPDLEKDIQYSYWSDDDGDPQSWPPSLFDLLYLEDILSHTDLVTLSYTSNLQTSTDHGPRCFIFSLYNFV